ncbi:hypothetical protein HPB52_017073 [Rhipicephalus sanguineus]|uniref:THAP-type domain-containing protein n=1 Tax=Rhipicephalus sanguineus TaxID=34632 RepID=A0A9D4YQF3_RHISA|nr:hypothetical protein HPB52_017073 [Rhipicephalus sanguineus]
MPNRCCTPGCRFGYKGTRKVSLFSLPLDKLQRGKGKRAIPQQESGDFNFESKYTGVCANHFDASDIVTTHDFNINGDYVSLKRDKPTLKADAVPRIFEGLPSYLTKRKPRSRSSTMRPPCKRPRESSCEELRALPTPCFYRIGQLDALDDAYEQYRRAIESRGEGHRGSQAKQRAWETHSEFIRCVGYCKNGRRGKEEWVRCEERRQGMSRATTGGGPEDVAPLDDLEARVANTLDPEAVFGVSGGLDIGAPTPDPADQKLICHTMD